MNSKSPSKAVLSEHHEWLARAIEQNNIKYFYSPHFKDFEFLGAGALGKVEKAIYDFDGNQAVYALKTVFYLQDANIGKKALTKFIKEASLYLYRFVVIIRHHTHENHVYS